MTTQEITTRILALEGVEKLNPMQQATLAAQSQALVLIAPTGSGKTIAFLSRAMRMVRHPDGEVQTIIIAPSRELVQQISAVARTLMKGHKVTALYGGHAMREETASLTPTPSVIVATPGRLLDHLQRGTLPTPAPRALVIDEYDKALELGFAEEMSRISRRIKLPRHITLTSATQLNEIPPYLHIESVETIDFSQSNAPTQVEAVRIESPARDKLDTLISLLRTLPHGKAIVFVNHRESAERVHASLIKKHIPAALYHGALTQDERQNAIDVLTNGTAPILVATDLAARGLDISGLNYVIHYHLPTSAETWTHRNGRTGRQQAEGEVFVITSEADTVPDYIVVDRTDAPTTEISQSLASSSLTTLRFDAGRKDKISKGDIAGFLMRECGLNPAQVGVISLHERYALAAVAKDAVAAVLERVRAGAKLKGKKCRIGILKNY